MIQSTKMWENHPRRRGAAIIYVLVSMVAMLGFCSFAVDLGRVQTAKTEIRRGVDGAARAAAAYLAQQSPGSTSGPVQTEAVLIAQSNRVDGTPLVLANSNIVIGSWNTSRNPPVFTKGGTPNPAGGIYSAVQISAVRQIPLLFGSILGARTCNVTATSTAALVSIQAPVTQYVSAHGDPWLAGEPAGTQGSVPDTGYDNPSKNDVHPWKYDVANPAAVAAAVDAAGSSGDYTPPVDSTKLYSTDYSNDEPYGSPTKLELAVTPGSVVTVSIPTSSSNLSNNQGYLDHGSADTYADGDGNNGGSIYLYSDDAANPSLPQGSNTTSGTEHGLSNIITPINSVVGVFMDQNGATYGADSTQETKESSAPPTPSGLDFATQTERDYTSLEPKINQTFYVGSGTTSTEIQQIIVVPPNASALFLGTMDGHEWSNNVGGFTATISQFEIELVH